jgi:hypothetical protein
MVNILRNLRINRVASVDKGAGEGVQVLLMKREDESEAEIDKKVTFRSSKDGAISLWHEADAVTDVEAPKKPKKKKIKKFAIDLLKQSVASLFDATPETEALLEKTFQEFETHVQSVMTASDSDSAATEAAIEAGTEGGINKGENKMTKEEMDNLNKQLKDATDALAKANADIAFLKMSKEEQDFAKNFSETEKAKFAAKKPDERKADMEDCAKKATEQVPESVKKALADAAVLKTEHEALQKRLDALEVVRENEALAKRATEVNVDVDTLRKARKGNVEAVTKLEDSIIALNKQVKEAGLFKEFGSSQTVGGNAYDQIQAKAAEVRKADSKLTPAQAFEKAYNDPANAELVKLYKREKQSVAA